MNRVVVAGGSPAQYTAAGANLVRRLNLDPTDVQSVTVVAKVGDVLKVNVTFLARAEDMETR